MEGTLDEIAKVVLAKKYLCNKYSCYVDEEFCAKRHTLAVEGIDKNNLHEIDYELCLDCRVGKEAKEKLGLEIRVPSEAKLEQSRDWMRSSGVTMIFKQKPCKVCSGMFQPRGGRDDTCTSCHSKHREGMIVKEETRKEIIVQTDIAKLISSDIVKKASEIRDLYTTLRMLKRYDDSIQLPDLKFLGGE